jgi:hypothetical protein
VILSRFFELRHQGTIQIYFNVQDMKNFNQGVKTDAGSAFFQLIDGGLPYARECCQLITREAAFVAVELNYLPDLINPVHGIRLPDPNYILHSSDYKSPYRLYPLYTTAFNFQPVAVEVAFFAGITVKIAFFYP